MLDALRKERLRNPAGSKFVYSDIGFIVLGEIIKRLSQDDLEIFVRENVFDIISQSNSDSINFYRFFVENPNIPGVPADIPIYIPPTNSSEPRPSKIPNKKINFSSVVSKIAPTENIRGQNSYLGAKYEGDEKSGNRMLRGQVHDPTAFEWVALPDTPDFFRLPTIWRVIARCF
jgi:hypothetical protein